MAQSPRRRQIGTFEEILVKGLYRGLVPARSIEAREWFRKEAKKTKVTAETLLAEDKARFVRKPQIGHMVLFNYDPKRKKTLPYYDTYPLIFCIGPANKGFMGINLHYLPYIWRARLMDALYDNVVHGKRQFDENTHLEIDYEILKSAAKFAPFKPCIKHYLWGHVASRFMHIPSVNWDSALYMPIARFQKASQQKVWADSRKKMGG